MPHWCRNPGGGMAGTYQSQERKELAERVAEIAATQRKQAAEVRRQQEELRKESERHLGKMAELAALLWAWAPPPQVCPEDSEAVEEPCGSPRQPEVVDEPRGGPSLPEEEEQPGEGLLLPGAVEEPLQSEAEDEAGEGLHLPEAEESLHPEVGEGLCLLGAEAQCGEPLQTGVAEAVAEAVAEQLCGETEVPAPGQPVQPELEAEERDSPARPGINRAMGVCGGAWSAGPCGRTCTASAITPAVLKHGDSGVGGGVV
uniref:uncharacterized protein LOC112436067 n=1 Tax=Maylandia zebra TaxID=106582 RepID=UPI000D31426D|nr:uncharacterized protein LOC112436067 [Maylandia zebra]